MKQQLKEKQLKRLHDQIKKGEVNLNTILNNTQDAVVIFDSQGRVTQCNPAAERLFGYRQEELQGEDVVEWIIHPEFRAFFCAELAACSNRRFELSVLKKESEPMDVSLSLTPFSQDNQTYFAAFIHDISQQKKLIESLLNTLKVSESSNQDKSGFIANMSHEIRTPMNAIIGFTELALSDYLPKQVKDYLTKTRDAAHALMGLLNDILDFSKIEAGKMVLDPTEFELHTLFDRLANLFSQQTSNKGLELVFSIPPHFEQTLFGDVRRLEQIMINLIGNAIKFTETGSIIIQSKPFDPTDQIINITFSIQDTGIGIPSNRLQQLFEPFEQADITTTRNYGGTGLGLTICKNLVSLMGGTLHAESQPKQGSLFSFTLPFECRQTILKKVPTFPKHMHGLKVLLVSQNTLTLPLLVDTLKTFSFDPHTAASGEEALHTLNTLSQHDQSYDLILLDYLLPNMDGIQTSKKIKEFFSSKDGLQKNPKIVLITSLDKQELHQQAQIVGVDQSINKPISRTQLFLVIMEVFGEKVLETDKPSHFLSGASDTTKKIGGARVLLVEDNLINQEMACELLERAGLTVETANNGQEAVDKIKATLKPKRIPFAAVLMDVQMPIMDGCEATRTIRCDPHFSKLPIIALTAHAMAEDLEKFLKVGMNAHLTKPIYPERLYGLLTEWIGPLHKTLTPDDTQETPLTTISGIDQVAGWRRVAGNKKLYHRLLVRFRQDQADVASEIDDALDRGDLKSAANLTHALKGVAGNVGAVPLQQAAEALEKAIKDGPPRAWRPEQKSFTTALTSILDGLAHLESVDSKSNSQPTNNRPIDTVKLTPLLTELATHLEGFSIETDSLMESIQKLLLNTHATPILQKLLKHMKDYEFDESLKALEELAKLLEIPFKR